MNISIILPVYNEADNLEKLFDEIVANLSSVTKKYEIIFVNDGSSDNSEEVIFRLYRRNSAVVKYINFVKHYGKSSALDAGFKLASGDIVFTMDSDGQDDPIEIPRFIDKINHGFDLVSGWKQNRQDTFIKNNTSKIYNYVTNRVFHLHLHDHNCGFKAYKKEVIKNLSIAGQQHRYIPVFVADMGYQIDEVKVHHRKRFSGKTKYGPKRFLNGFLDLLTVYYLVSFKAKPMHLFGSIGIFSSIVGVIFCLISAFKNSSSFHFFSWLALFGIFLIISGIQLVFLGLLAEQISQAKNHQKPLYQIKSTQP